MEELYWLTRLDNIYGVFVVAVIFGVIAVIVSGFSYLCSKRDGDETKKDKKLLKISAFVLLLGTLGVVFIPTTREALVIYGVGGTIDYVKSNEIAKKIPDKAIKALDRFLDEYPVNNNKK